MNKYFLIPLLGFLLVVISFFHPFFLKGKLPIPSDTIVGLYHPFRDLYAGTNPNGLPYKNFLVTDPVRQQYPWRELGINLLKKGMIPLWNPYVMAGMPFLANFQSAVFYPLNILFFFMPFELTWSLLIVLQPFLAMMFMYLFLRNIRLNQFSCLLGAIAYAFSGVSVAWLEWNTIGHLMIWLPLILLAKDKLLDKWTWKWTMVLVFAEISLFFSGHLQIWLYSIIITSSYLVARIYQIEKNHQPARNPVRLFRSYLPFILIVGLILIILAVQWIPTLQFVQLSARDIDLDWQVAGWFVPLQHLVQFIAPDYFGNYSTLNYWGTWNYGELVGYIGILPLLLAMYALISRRDKKTLFFGGVLLLALIFSIQNPIAELPYRLQVPLLSTIQPTRLMFIIDFALVILAALGCDYLLKSKKALTLPLALFGFIFAGLWVFTIFFGSTFNILAEDLDVARRNLIFPTVVFGFTGMGVIAWQLIKHKQLQIIILAGLLMLTVFDLYRFFSKFTPFTERKYLFPQTQTLYFLQNQQGKFRIMATDDKILPPNFSSIYRLETVDGYDPLYLRRYGELISAIERDEPDISPPFGFKRIIAPSNINSPLINLLNVKYVLTFDEIESTLFSKVFEEGKTIVYENKTVLPRAFMVSDVIEARDKQDAINKVFEYKDSLNDIAIVESPEVNNASRLKKHEFVAIAEYTENKVIIGLSGEEDDRFLVLTDSYYPTWKARGIKLNGEVVDLAIYRTNYAFRGVFVPKGVIRVEFYNTLL